MADLAEVFAIRTELEDLCCRRAVCRADHIASIENKDVSFRVHGHARGFAEMQVRRKLEEVRHGVERYFRHGLLSKQRGTQYQKQRNDETFHGGPPRVLWMGTK